MSVFKFVKKLIPGLLKKYPPAAIVGYAIDLGALDFVYQILEKTFVKVLKLKPDQSKAVVMVASAAVQRTNEALMTGELKADSAPEVIREFANNVFKETQKQLKLSVSNLDALIPAVIEIVYQFQKLQKKAQDPTKAKAIAQAMVEVAETVLSQETPEDPIGLLMKVVSKL